MGALSDPRVEKLFVENFITAHQRIGDFQRMTTPIGTIKVGGNVASYFCTPEGRVIHGVLGPASAEVLLAEANWALQTYKPIAKDELARQKEHLAKKHAEAARTAPDRPGAIMLPGDLEPLLEWPAGRGHQIHELFAKHPLASLTEAYRYIFERLLHEPVSDQALAQLAQREKKASGEGETEQATKPAKTPASTHRPTANAAPVASRPPDPEHAAQRKLELAKKLALVNRAEAKRWLADVVEKFPGSVAAKEAAVVLKQIQ